MRSSGLWHCVVLQVGVDFSEEHFAAVFMVYGFEFTFFFSDKSEERNPQNTEDYSVRRYFRRGSAHSPLTVRSWSAHDLLTVISRLGKTPPSPMYLRAYLRDRAVP